MPIPCHTRWHNIMIWEPQLRCTLGFLHKNHSKVDRLKIHTIKNSNSTIMRIFEFSRQKLLDLQIEHFSLQKYRTKFRTNFWLDDTLNHVFVHESRKKCSDASWCITRVSIPRNNEQIRSAGQFQVHVWFTLGNNSLIFKQATVL